MQSGSARTKKWVLEYEPEAARQIDPLMGWTSSGDMKSQIRMMFDTKEDAVSYAKRNKIEFVVTEPKKRKTTKKSYSDNFRFGRLQPWTH